MWMKLDSRLMQQGDRFEEIAICLGRLIFEAHHILHSREEGELEAVAFGLVSPMPHCRHPHRHVCPIETLEIDRDHPVAIPDGQMPQIVSELFEISHRSAFPRVRQASGYV